MERHRVGIMQGRLSPPIDGKVQSFPSASWREEFALAAECEFELLEWVFDAADWERNPLMTAEGRTEIAALSKTHAVAVPIVCADYFMDRPLTSPTEAVRAEARDVLADLIRSGSSIGISRVELPLIGAGSLADAAAARMAVELFRDIRPLLESSHVDLLLEVDLAPNLVGSLFRSIESQRICLNYDTGNSAYWGFDPREEFASYGQLIRNVHVKDVTKNDYTVALGKGEVDFDLSFTLLKEAGYTGDFVLQAARGEDDLAVAREYASFTRRYIDRYLA